MNDPIEKKSLLTVRIHVDLKDTVINAYLNEITKTVKSNIKRRKIVIYVVEDKN